MSNRIYAPSIKHYIDWLGRIRYREYGDMTTYDERSYELLDELFSLIKNLEPVYPNGARELWLCAERGPIEAFGDYEEYLEEEMVSNYNEFVELWKDYFPDEICWYNFGALEDEATGYRAIFLGNKHILEQDREKEKSAFVYEITDLVEWLIESLRECLAELEAGTYNARVDRELPPLSIAPEQSPERTGGIRFQAVEKTSSRIYPQKKFKSLCSWWQNKPRMLMRRLVEAQK